MSSQRCLSFCKSVMRAVFLMALAALSFVALPGQSSAQGTGDLLMTTYPTRTFSGTPITTGPVTVIDQTNLDPGGQRDRYSVRIEGFVRAETTGTYTFETLSDDGIRVFVDGTRIINNYRDHAATINTGTIDLVAGTWYPILIEHYENRGGQRLRLRWRSLASRAPGA